MDSTTMPSSITSAGAVDAPPVVVNSYRPLKGGASDGASETSFLVNLAALAASLAVLCGAYVAGLRSPAELFVLLPVSLLVFTVVLESLFHPRTCALRRLKVRRRLDVRRVLLREFALLATLLAIGFAYWLLPAFRDKDMCEHYYPFLCFLVPLLLVLGFPYFCLMDVVDPEGDDEYLKLGRALAGFKRTMTRFEFANYARGWIVKAFWLSLMQPSTIMKLKFFIGCNWQQAMSEPVAMFAMASAVCYGIDLCYASSGYLLNFKMFNTHTRTAEPTFLGWAAAVACYWPFWAILFHPYFFNYHGAKDWMSVFATGGAAWHVWAAAIIALEALYAMATVAAGIRFSNLTYRGLWNTGPYRWTKHPAYVFKNVSWWLVSLPFIANSGAAALKCSLLLLGVNALYFLRARTEEAHLSHYPEYVAYATAMNDKSIFRWCAKLLPFLKYRPPRAAEKLFEVCDESAGGGLRG